MLVLAAALPLAAILFFNLYSIREAKEREVHEEAFRMGQLAALEMQRVLGGIEDTLLSIAAAPAVQSLDPVACNQYIVRIGGRLDQFAGIAVLDAQGIIRCRQEPKGIGVSLADRPYVVEAMKGGFAVGEYTVGRVSSRKVLPVAVPIKDDKAAVIGVVAASLDLDWLDRKVRERTFAVDSNLTIADRNGVILARHPDPERFVGTAIPRQYQSLVHADKPGTLELMSQDGTKRILAYFPPAANQQGLYISAGISTAEEYAAVNSALYYGITVTTAATLGALIFASTMGRYSIRRPVEHLLRTVEAWRGHDEQARTGMAADGGEFGRLGAAIDAYMDELVIARTQRQKDEEQRTLLTQELDHRVKNLLATVQAVARQTFRSTSVDPASFAMFNQRLAAIGEAHALLMKGGWQSASLLDIVNTAIRPFNTSEPSRFTVSGPELVLHSRAALGLGMVLHELSTNAVKYGALSDDAGHVHIWWETTTVGDAASLFFEWRETGGPTVIPPENKGFGSTMIERMLGSQIGGKVEMAYEVTGAVFRVTVPVKNVELETA